MSEKTLQTLQEAIDHVDKGAKDKGKPKPRRVKEPKRSGTEIKAVNLVPNEDYRANYSAIFGHD